MPTVYHDHWARIISAIRDRITKSGNAEIEKVIVALQQAGKIPEATATSEDMEAIIGQLEDKNEHSAFRKGAEIHIKKNPNFELNESMKATNASIKNLNDVIIPGFNRRQNTLTIITLVVAALSFLAIALSAFYASKAITSTELQETNRHLQNNTRILDSMLQSQKGIDSSLRKAVKDSFYRAHR